MPKQEPELPQKRGRGRPKGQTLKVAERNLTLREIAQQYIPEAMRVVAEIAMDPEDRYKPNEKLAAINILLDRGYGRAAQAEPTPADTGDVPLQRIERVIVEPAQKKAKVGEKTG